MSTTTKTKTEAPQAAPPAQPIATINKREAWEDFNVELKTRADEIGSQLPSNVGREKFLNASLAAVKANPDILLATPRSLFAALIKAAQDGLLPDGREGIITVFRQKVYGSSPERHEMIAAWNPMFYGIRKRARELDGIIIDAQVVYVGDEFEYELGDNPFIKHKPKPRTEKIENAASGLAAYAIFRHPTEGILAREVMWKHEIFDTMNQSRAKTSLMWTTFWTEGWRKTVGRRGSKSVPVSAALERLIQRDDENFSFDATPAAPRISAPATLPEVPDDDDKPVVASGAVLSDDVKIKAGGKTIEVDPQTGQLDQRPGLDGHDEPDFNNDDSGFKPEGEIDADAARFLERLNREMGLAKDEAEVEQAFDDLEPQVKLSGNDLAIARAFEMKERQINELARGRPAKTGTPDTATFFLPEVPE